MMRSAVCFVLRAFLRVRHILKLEGKEFWRMNSITFFPLTQTKIR